MIIDAIAEEKTIIICGDYDADGITSTALLLRTLRQLEKSEEKTEDESYHTYHQYTSSFCR